MGLNAKVLPQNILRAMDKPERANLGKAGTLPEEVDAKFAAKSEKKLQENIASLLWQRDIWFHRARMDRKTTGPVGCPDFLFSYASIPVAIEAKFGKGQLTAEQEATARAMTKNHWWHFVVRSEAEFLRALATVETVAATRHETISS